MNNMIGKMLDNRYELLEVIGSGGMAVVYKAKCHRLNRLVAVKVLKSDLAEDADFRRRFRDESQAVAMLSHPNIVSVYDVSRGETEYIVMELIDGITLKQYMEKRGQLNWREALHFITQIMKALSHAHSRGIIHRDIKPQNIMVLRDGSVKVADFGIACLANSANTLTQEALGSVHYMSPEQARGDRTDARSDIYSAGVVLYEMLTGRLPFEGDNAVSVAIQHLSSVPLSPREINPDVPEALELICMKAMASDLEKRYASADEMLADLEEFRKNPEVDLDFTIEDLHRETVDEPTQYIPAVHTVSKAQKVQEADDEEEEEASPHKLGTRKLLTIIGAAVAAVALIVLLWHAIFSDLLGGEQTPTEYVVPYLIGMTIDEANEDENVKGIFTIEQIGQRASSKYAAGQIIEQSPERGKTVKGNRVISVFVSSGAKTEKMPNLVNKEYRDATLQLTNLDLNLVAHVGDLRRLIDVLVGHLGDVHQALDALAQVAESAERDKLGHSALDDSADGVLLDQCAPRILGGLLETQGDALAVEIDVENLDLDLLADLDNLGRMVDVVPGELGDVDEAVDTAEVDEGAEVNDGGNGALETHARLELGQDLGALGLTGLLEHDATGEDDVVAVAVHLDDAGLDAGAHVGGEVLDATEVNEGGRQEAAQADVEDKAALDDLDDLALDGLAGVELLLDGVPGALVLGTLLGEDETALLVLLLENQSLDLVVHGNDVSRVDILADGELAGRNDALGLVADVKQDLVALDLDDGAGDKIALIKVGDGAVDEVVHLLVGNVIQRKDGRVLNLTQRWTPFELRGPDC